MLRYKCGYSLVVERYLAKVETGFRLPLPAPVKANCPQVLVRGISQAQIIIDIYSCQRNRGYYTYFKPFLSKTVDKPVISVDKRLSLNGLIVLFIDQYIHILQCIFGHKGINVSCENIAKVSRETCYT